MIPLRDLNKKDFQQLLHEARLNIRRFSKEWTDENYHDPGITLLELFSWLTEMQRYYLNRIPDRSVHSLLKFFGIKETAPSLGKCLVSFSGFSGDLNLPEGIKLEADEQIFETCQPFHYVDNHIDRVFLNNGVSVEHTHLNNQVGMCFPLFGEPVAEGAETVLLLRRPLPQGVPVTLLFTIKTDYLASLNVTDIREDDPRCQWILGDGDNSAITVLNDGTKGFRQSGVIHLRLNQAHEKSVYLDHEGFLLRIRSVGDSCMTPPMADSISLNAAQVENRNTLVSYSQFDRESEFLNREICQGPVLVQGSDDAVRWMDIPGDQIKAVSDGLKVRFEPKANYNRYRAVFNDVIQVPGLVVGSGTGLPCQTLRYRAEKVLTDRWLLQICDADGCWSDWRYVPDLIKAGGAESVFTYDREEEQLLFGDNEHGRIPPKGNDNIRLLQLVKTDYERGNVKRGKINQFSRILYPQSLQVTNTDDSEGGRPEQTMDDMKNEVLHDFNRVYRAITADDYEEILKRVPGYRMSYVKALPNHKGENQVSIVAVPYNGQRTPMADREAVKAMRTWLEDFRMVTTRVDFIDPVFVEVSVHVVLRVKNRNSYDSHRMEEALVNLLTPIRGYEINRTYVIGTIPGKSELLKFIHKDVEITNIEQLIIDAKGLGVRKNAEGEISMPTNGIIMAGDIRLEVLD